MEDIRFFAPMKPTSAPIEVESVADFAAREGMDALFTTPEPDMLALYALEQYGRGAK